MPNKVCQTIFQLSNNTSHTKGSLRDAKQLPTFLSIGLQFQKLRDKLISIVNYQMPKQYDHNVDVKSTQAADAVKSIGKSVEKLAEQVVGIWVLTFFGFITIAIGINAFKHLSMHSKTSGNAMHFDPWNFKSEYAQNSQRARSKFMDKYVKMTGRITGLYGSSFVVESYGNKIDCDFPNYYFGKQWYNRDFVNNYNMGQTINVRGILTGANVRDTPSKFRLTHCTPD